MDKLLTFWNFIGRHKYLLTFAVFLFIIGIADENNLIRRAANKREIIRLTNEIEKYRREYEESTRRLNELVENPEAMEKIAREKYLMKKPNEDIYVFEEE